MADPGEGGEEVAVEMGVDKVVMEAKVVMEVVMVVTEAEKVGEEAVQVMAVVIRVQIRSILLVYKLRAFIFTYEKCESC